MIPGVKLTTYNKKAVILPPFLVSKDKHDIFYYVGIINCSIMKNVLGLHIAV